MSEQNEQQTPQPGQWWIHDDAVAGESACNSAIKILHVNFDNSVIAETTEGYHRQLRNIRGWHHEPRCTGWDWVVPPVESQDDWVTQDTVPPRQGIDQIRWSYWQPGEWTDVGSGHPKIVHGYIAPGGHILFVRCRRRDLPVVESPDDWVTQDLVPMRPGVDEWRWKSWNPEKWQITDPSYIRSNGYASDWSEEDTIEVRCRRRDFPAVPQEQPETEQPQRRPVRLWVSDRAMSGPTSNYIVRVGDSKVSAYCTWIEIKWATDVGFFVDQPGAP